MASVPPLLCAAGVEAAEVLGPPLLQGPSEAGDLGIGQELNEFRMDSAAARPAAGVCWWYTERTCCAHSQATARRSR